MCSFQFLISAVGPLIATASVVCPLLWCVALGLSAVSPRLYNERTYVAYVTLATLGAHRLTTARFFGMLCRLSVAPTAPSSP